MSRLLKLTGFGCLFAVMVSSATASGALSGALAVTPPSDRRVAILYKAPTAPHDAGNDGGSPGPGGGSRSGGNCAATPIALTAIVPEPKGFGQTASSRPTVWVYVPYTSQSHIVTFVVQDDAQQTTTPIRVKLPTKAGVVGIPWPAKVPSLVSNRVYRWSLQVACGEKLDTASGWIEQVTLAPGVQKQLAQATSPPQKAAVYAENGVWYDALTALGTGLQTKAGNPAATADWLSLLTQAKPESIADATNWAKLLQQIESKDVTVQTIEP